jgi:hypothetical protein
MLKSNVIFEKDYVLRIFVTFISIKHYSGDQINVQGIYEFEVMYAEVKRV